jgi:ferredoxin
MMKKLKIEYRKDLCISQGSCAAIAPDHFELLGKKATLKNSRNIGRDTYVIELDCDEHTAENLIEAGKACPVNAIKVIDIEKNEDIVGINIKGDNVKEVVAQYDDAKEFVIDDKGYFLIRLDRKNKNIEVAFCIEKNRIVLKVVGKKPIDIYQTLLNKENLDIRKDHAAYLGRELQKAYIALKNNLKYVQDDELDLDKKVNQ